MSDSLTKKTVKSSVWSIIDVLLRQGISFIISIVLTRLLSPSDYGTIGMLMMFIAVSNVFIDSGFSAGLIRKIDRTEEDLSTAFIFNIIVGSLVYLLLFYISPLVAQFFDDSTLCTYLRVLGLILIINSFNLVQNAILIYTMQIRLLTIISALSQISTGTIAILFAYNGYGIWALIIQQLAASLITALLLFFKTGWKPQLRWNWISFQYLWNFGSKLLLTNLISTFCGQLYSFFIGKYIGKKELGLYTRSDSFARQPLNIFNNIINKALVPSLASCQNDLSYLRDNYKKCIEIMSFAGFPIMFCLASISKPLFAILFGEKWIDAAPLFSILCIGFSIAIVGGITLQLIQVMGRTDYTLKLELIKKPIFVILAIIGCSQGIKGIVIFSAIYELVGTLINLTVVHTLLQYNYFGQLIDIFKYAGITLLILSPIVIISNILNINYLWQFFTILPLFFSLYLFFSFLFKVKALCHVKQIVSKIRKRA